VFEIADGQQMYNWTGALSAFSNRGTFSKPAGPGISYLQSLYVDNQGLLSVESGTMSFSSSHLDNMATGTIGGTGTFNVQGATSYVNNGIVSPGLSPGVLTFNLNYTSTASSMLELEFAGLSVGTEYDRLAVNGTAGLDGGIAVSMLDDYLPGVYDEFTVVTHSGYTGAFTTPVIAINDSLYFYVDYRDTEVVLITRQYTIPVLDIDFIAGALMLSWEVIDDALYYNVYSGEPYGPHTLLDTTYNTEYDVTSFLGTDPGSFYITAEMPEEEAARPQQTRPTATWQIGR
jgi:hypothetical protein